MSAPITLASNGVGDKNPSPLPLSCPWLGKVHLVSLSSGGGRYISSSMDWIFLVRDIILQLLSLEGVPYFV